MTTPEAARAAEALQERVDFATDDLPALAQAFVAFAEERVRANAATLPGHDESERKAGAEERQRRIVAWLRDTWSRRRGGSLTWAAEQLEAGEWEATDAPPTEDELGPCGVCGEPLWASGPKFEPYYVGSKGGSHNRCRPMKEATDGV